ncbi:hypothetical protein ABMC89_08450 [Sulfitobacter sp. HNIBRBA3233]|uniref:hypothetical protein n=1 Tax=Sulfitobacter marinivivus TaxID=3158558 RepID=UPI0032DF2F5F
MNVPLAAWRPSLSVYVKHVALVGVATLAVMAAAGWAIGVATGYWQALYAGPAMALVYFVLFDDPLRWRSIRQTRWQLTTETLTHGFPDGEESIPLADVVDVRSRLGHSVVAFLRGGMRVRISYVEDPSEIAAQILRARDRAVAGPVA